MKQIPALVLMSNISKRFGTILANDNVNFSIGAGKIHALLGENGAGKSTLLNRCPEFILRTAVQFI